MRRQRDVVHRDALACSARRWIETCYRIGGRRRRRRGLRVVAEGGEAIALDAHSPFPNHWSRASTRQWIRAGRDGAEDRVRGAIAQLRLLRAFLRGAAPQSASPQIPRSRVGSRVHQQWSQPGSQDQPASRAPGLSMQASGLSALQSQMRLRASPRPCRPSRRCRCECLLYGETSRGSRRVVVCSGCA